MRKKILIAAVIAAALVVLVLYGFLRANRQGTAVLTSDQLNETGTDTSNAADIKVHVAGAVMNPGVYTLKSDARVIDAVEAAGGVTENADTDALNLAATVSDGEKIQVYTYDETSGEASGTSGGLININTASKETLMTLSGIGEVLAENIITYREENGGFKSKEELKEVNRIGDKLYEQIEGKVTI